MLELPHLPHRQFGQNVCRIRNLQGLTQEKLAERADVSRRYLQQIEAGEMNPTINIITRLKQGLDCSWEDLLKGIGEKQG